MNPRNTSEPIQQDAINREATIILNLKLVESVARHFHRRVPTSVAYDDLASAGVTGLIQAVDRFDPNRGLKFKTYAQHRIYGAIQDFLRDEDPLSRTQRRLIRESATSLSASNDGIPPTTVSLELIPERYLAAPEQVQGVACSEVRKARRCLSARENRVIELLYDFGWLNREVAADLGVNESRVSQIKCRALAKLRHQFETDSHRRAA